MDENEVLSPSEQPIIPALETFIKSLDGLLDAFPPTRSAILSSITDLWDNFFNSMNSLLIEFADAKNIDIRKRLEDNLSNNGALTLEERKEALDRVIDMTFTILQEPSWMKSYSQRVPLMLNFFRKLGNDFEKIQLSEKLVQRSFIISLISQYDDFLAKLIRALFLIRPETLNASEKNISLTQLQNFNTIDDAIEFIIGKETENVMRKSHSEQIEWLEKQYNIDLRKELPLQNFIEITERRNLFVHNNGFVSDQYIDICKKNSVLHAENVIIGKELEVSPEYFKQAVESILEIGIKLAHLLWRKIYPKGLEEADDNLTNICFDFLVEERYSLACAISDFATETLRRHSNDRSKRIFIVNRAQAYKWAGNNEKAKAIINSIDWSASSQDFQLAKAVIMDDFDEANNLLRKIGAQGDISIVKYREWPLFKEYRNTEAFLNTFEEVFQESFYNEKDVFIAIDRIKDLTKLENSSVNETPSIKMPLNEDEERDIENNS